MKPFAVLSSSGLGHDLHLHLFGRWKGGNKMLERGGRENPIDGRASFAKVQAKRDTAQKQKNKVELNHALVIKN